MNARSFLAWSLWAIAAVSTLPIAVMGQTFYMPMEDGPHYATWLQWPHDFGLDPQRIARYETMWIEMTVALTENAELVNIIVYDDNEQSRVRMVLQNNGVNMNLVQLFNAPTDDVWVRDNGPIFVDADADGSLFLLDFIFNGWGNKQVSANDDPIPQLVSSYIGTPAQSVNLVVEGGAFEVDGRGTFMAKRASILNNNRNPGLTQADVEAVFTQHLGVTNFIWLDGIPGLDLTDDHIDGTARFADSPAYGPTIVTMARDDFTEPTEHDILTAARDANGNPYRIVELPVTTRQITGGFTGNVGIYVNYYAGNNVVLVPAFNDPNDSVAANVLQGVYPDKNVVLINSEELYADGGVIHCVTQQQHRAPGTTAPPPTAAPPGGGDPEPIICLPEDVTVQHREKGSIPVRDLQVGDYVLVDTKVNAGDDVYEPVYGFGHKLADTTHANFLQLTVASGPSVTLSQDHMVFVRTSGTKPRAVPARLVQVGDQLQLDDNASDNADNNAKNDELAVVVETKVVEAKGLYAPFTPSGSIVANGIRVSTFASLQGTEFVVVAGYTTGISHQWLYQTLTLPHRLWCHHLLGSCEKETYVNGMATWTYYPYQFVYVWWPQQTVAVQTVLGVVIGVAFLMLGLLHGVTMYPLSAVALALLLFYTICSLGWKCRGTTGHHHTGKTKMINPTKMAVV